MHTLLKTSSSLQMYKLLKIVYTKTTVNTISDLQNCEIPYNSLNEKD